METPVSETPHPSPNALPLRKGRWLTVAALIAAPAIIDLGGWSLSEAAASGLVIAMLLASLPFSFGAALLAALTMRTKRALLLLWIPLFSFLALVVCLGLQAGSCALIEPRIDFR